MLYVLNVLIELDDVTVEKHQRSFGGFKRDRRTLVAGITVNYELRELRSNYGDTLPFTLFSS